MEGKRKSKGEITLDTQPPPPQPAPYFVNEIKINTNLDFCGILYSTFLHNKTSQTSRKVPGSGQTN